MEDAVGCNKVISRDLYCVNKETEQNPASRWPLSDPEFHPRTSKYDMRSDHYSKVTVKLSDFKTLNSPSQ
jgi:hypothetical protein